MIGRFGGLRRTGWQLVPRPANIPGNVVAGIGLERELCVLSEQFVAKNPVRVEDIVFAEVSSVVVLENAADLNVGQSEGLGHVFHAAGLDDRFVESLAVEVDDGAVRFNGAGVNVDDAALFLQERDFDVAVLSTFLGQNLDAEINIFVSGIAAVVPIDLTKQNDGGRSRSLGLAGQLQFIRRDGLEVHRPDGVRNQNGQRHEKERYETSKRASRQHGAIPLLEVVVCTAEGGGLKGESRGHEAAAGLAIPICRVPNLCVETIQSELSHVKESPQAGRDSNHGSSGLSVRVNRVHFRGDHFSKLRCYQVIDQSCVTY